MSRKGRKLGSLKYQASQRFNAMARRGFGTSKHDDQVAARERGERYAPAKDKIYSSNTQKTYLSAACKFFEWCNDRGYKGDLDDQRSHVIEYLKDRQNGWTHNKSMSGCAPIRESPCAATTVYRDAAALAKLYETTIDEWRTGSTGNSDGIAFERRSYDKITRGRDPRTWQGHFSEEKNKDLVDFCRSCGLRRNEIETLKAENVYKDPVTGAVKVDVLKGKGKGGKARTVTCLDDTPLRLAQQALANGKEYVFDSLPKAAPIHWYRSDFAREVYARCARDTESLSSRELYHPRGGGMDGMVFDRAALKEVSLQLGHSRLDVVPHHYLYPR